MDKIKKNNFSLAVIVLFFLAIPFVNFNHHKYEKHEGVIEWDIKSYYAYLPAAFIEKDLSLSFMDEDIVFWGKWIWPITTPTGNKAILTSMGMSVMYSPFFFIAHGYCKISDKYEANGYTKPYHIALTFSAWIYFIIGLLFLRKLLLKYFSEFSASLTLLFVGAGTNLFYYTTYEAPMSHCFNFVLITILVFLIDKWWEKENNWKYTIGIGLLAGLITLIRPTNIIVLLLIPLYGVAAYKDLGKRITNLVSIWPHLLVMAVFFILVWVPQFAYWHKVAGKIFYFSYGEVGSAFYFNNPQIKNILFSWQKGWFIYTPVMFFATLGFYFLIKNKIKVHVAFTVFFIVNLYILSSWWSWWFGGGFSIRAFVDSYGIMAFPLAALIEQSRTRKILNYSLVSVLLILSTYNTFQCQQYRYVAIHYWWNNKEVYFENFLKTKPTCKAWYIYNQPDVIKARQGIYEAIPFVDNNVTREDLYNRLDKNISGNQQLTDSLLQVSENGETNFDSFKKEYIDSLIDNRLAKNVYKQLRIEHYIKRMHDCTSWKKEIERMARRKNISFDEAALSEAQRIFETYSQDFIK
ncbi:MAG: hypothetical protein JXA77_18635 [Bacteroidales bacterium]|nr:hypothetical protein [Bacteroidales bacterium]MBN2818204.1 hypothetical protein [Bacteroidales bacterium]